MNLSEKYIQGLKKTYFDEGAGEEWEHFENIINGISDSDKNELLKIYPEIPKSLLELLEFADGTYYRLYKNEEITFYFLGSDVDDGEYPYYLYSAQQIIEQSTQHYNDNFADLFYYYLEDKNNEYGLFVDERIKMDGSEVKWLCFSDCMNNGGTSSLYIDFTPSETGKKGQIIRYLHDPDELRVIADSFDEYLGKIIDNKFPFVDSELM